MRPGIRKFCIILAISIGILVIPFLTAVNPWNAKPYSEQKTFNLDFDYKNFSYDQRQLNETGYPFLYTYTYYGASNSTFFLELPKNSTVSSSTFRLTGLILVNQTSIGDELHSINTGNLTINQGNEMAVGLHKLGGNTTRVYSGAKGFLWGYDVGDDVYDLKIGNLSSYVNRLVLGYDQGIVVLDSGGVKLDNNSVGMVRSLDLGNITADPGNEIVAGGDNLYLLNSTLDLLRNSTAITAVYGVDIGDVTSLNPGNEIAVGTGGTDNKIYLLNYTSGSFMIIWSYIASDTINDVAIGNISTDAGNEIVGVSEDNKVYALNSTGHSLWNYTLGDDGSSVVIGEFADTNPGNEIAVGSGGEDSNNSIYILNSTGDLILSYGADGYVRGIDMGNVTGDEDTNINEILGVTSAGSIYEMNYDAYPTDLVLRVNGTLIWGYSGKFRTTQVVDFANLTAAVQNFLDGCGDKVCVVPVDVYSSHRGRLRVSEINVSYTYDAGTDIHNVSVSPSWAKNDSVKVNESVISEAINVSYTEPALNISIGYMKIAAGATGCGFKNEGYQVVSLYGDTYCNVTQKNILIEPGQSPFEYHLLWHNLMQSDIPIYLNESQPYNISEIDNYLWLKNITIWSNATQEDFTNIIANTTLNDNFVKGDVFLNVTWGGTVYDITPWTVCPGMSNVGNGFYACHNDTDEDSRIDFFNWTQPNASAGSLVFYQAGGSRNLAPNMTSPGVSPATGLWDSNFTFSIDVDDGENDGVNVTLWVYENMTGTWSAKQNKNITGTGTLEFNLTSGKNWMETNKYMFEYFDYNVSSPGQMYHSAQNTSESTGPVVTLHNITLEHVQGNNTNVSREYDETTVILKVFLNDSTGYANWTGETCGIWVTLDGNVTDGGHVEPVNSSGYCNHTFDPNSSYSAGPQVWSALINETFYNITNAQNFTVRIRGHMNISISRPSAGGNVLRNQSQDFEAYLSDEYGNVIDNSSINTSDYSCNFYFNGTSIGSDQVNASGYCNRSWIPDCTYQTLKQYVVNATLSGQNATNYTLMNNETYVNVNLVDYPLIFITEPVMWDSFYKGTQVDLNATVNDTCDTCGINLYRFMWYINYRYLKVKLNETAGLDRYNEPVGITGQEMEGAGMNLTIWKANDTKVYCGPDSMPLQIIGSTYLDSGSEIVFLANLTSGQNKTCYVTHNESGSLQNSTISYVSNGGFESGQSTGWSCGICAKSDCNCTVAQEGTEQDGSYSLRVSAEYGISSAKQVLDYPLSSQYLKIKFKTWGEYDSGAYLRLTAGSGTCDLTLNPGSIAQGSAVWNTTLCNDSSFYGANSVNVSVYDVGDGGGGIDASHVHVDYICVADQAGNCLTLDSGVEMHELEGKVNITAMTENSTENQWTIPIDWQVGPYTVFGNLSNGYYLSEENETYVDIFGLSNVSQFNFTPVVAGECEGNLCFTGVDLKLVCGVADKNTSAGIYNYTVNLYNDSTMIGTEQTNATGYAEFLWENSTSLAGAHQIKCNITDSPGVYYNVTQENYMNFTIIFSSATTNGTMNVTPPAVQTVYNLTRSGNDTATFDVVVNNTGIGNMFGIRVLVFNQTGITGYPDTCSYLPNETSCTGNVTFNVSREAALGMNQVNMSLRWSNPDPAGPGFENKTVSINVTNTTFLNINESILSYVLPYGSTDYLPMVTEDYGNAALYGVFFNLSGGNWSAIRNWIMLNGTPVNQTSFSVARIGQSFLNVSVTVPDNISYMSKSYWAYLNASVSQLFCDQSYENCKDMLLINITVTQQDWTLDPKTDDMRVAGLNSNQEGNYTTINITNYKPYNLTLNVTKLVTNSTWYQRGSQFFNITLNSSGTSMPLPSTPFNISPLSSSYLIISYNSTSATSDDVDTYHLNLSLENQNSSAVPVWINISRILMISDFEVVVINPTQGSKLGPVDAGNTLTLYVNATLGESQHLNESMGWRIWVGGQPCILTGNTSNTTGAPYNCDWVLNCTAPTIPGNPINNTLIVEGNYTVLPLTYNDTETDAIVYNDISSPRIWTVEVIPEGQSSSTAMDGDTNVHYSLESTDLLLIRVNITDNNLTTVARINISRNGINVVTNDALTRIGNYWEYNYTNPKTIGDYKVDVYATDSSGNANNTWSSVTGYFDIYKPMTFLSNFTYPGGTPINVNLSFYKPSTSWRLHQNYSSSLNMTVHKRSYDIKAILLGHTVILWNSDLNYSSSTQFGESDPGNITNPVKFDYLPNYTFSQINIMPSKFEDPILGFVVEPANLSSAGGANITANITLNYTQALQAALDGGKSINVQNLEVLECDSWDYAARDCTGGLDNADYIDVTPSGGLIRFQTDINSGYIVAEGCYAGGSLIDCSGYEDIYIPSSGSSGSSEKKEEVTSFAVETNLDSRSFGDITMYQGETKVYWLYVTNRLSKEIKPVLSLEGPIKDFMTFSETSFSVESGKSKRITATIYIPEETPIRTYTGNILVDAEGETDEIPVTINVVKRDEGEIMLEVNIIKKTLEVGEPLKFQVKLRNMGTEKELKPTLTYLIKEDDTDRLIKEQKENVTLEKMLSFTRTISLNETGIDEGGYLLEVWAEIDGKAVSYMETFDLVKPFLATTLGITLLYTLLILSIVIATIFIRKYYVGWKAGREGKKRYIFPVDMTKIPQKIENAFWIGTLAGSKIKAWINPDDLTTHALVAGATGSGKSVGASIIVEEALDQKIPVIVFDPTAQWTGFVRSCKDNNLLKHYPTFGMDIRNTRPYKGMIFEMSNPKQKIEFKEFMNPGEITVFTLSGLKPEEFDEAVRNIIDSMFRIKWEEATGLKMIVVFDEVHRLLEKYGGKGGYVSLEKACREFRKWGIGLIMCSQVLADFKEAVSGNVLTDVQLNTKSLEDIKKAREKYGADYAKRITRQGLGVGMIHNPKYNDGKPYFIQFRPTWHNPHKITNEELEQYKQFAVELKEIRAKIEEMEKQGKEIFDIKLELKLAEDKLKLGNFRMAKIYIASLKKSLSGGA